MDEAQLAIRNTFLIKLPARLENIEKWVETGDWIKVQAEAHQLAAAGLFGFDDISFAAKKLEEVAQANMPKEMRQQTELLISVCSKHVVPAKESVSKEL